MSWTLFWQIMMLTLLGGLVINQWIESWRGK